MLLEGATREHIELADAEHARWSRDRGNIEHEGLSRDVKLTGVNRRSEKISYVSTVQKNA
jgi:hypothetical protein